MKPKGDV